MQPIIISEASISKSVKEQNSRSFWSFCCCGHRSRSTISIRPRTGNNPKQQQQQHYEYVVEKLVLRRVPVDSSSSTSRKTSGRTKPEAMPQCAPLDASGDACENEPSYTFNSYCQLTPQKYAHHRKELLSDKAKKPPPASPPPPPQPPVRIPNVESRQKTFYPMLPAQQPRNSSQKSRTKSNIPTPFNESPKMRHTLDMLAKRAPNENSYMSKNPGIKLIPAESTSSELPLKLQDVYCDVDDERCSRTNHCNLNRYLLDQITADMQSNQGVKWKLVIKQRKPTNHHQQQQQDC